MISMDKKYRTRDGRDVRLLCVDGHPEWPVCGLIDGDNTPSAWDGDGSFAYDGIHDYDLIEHREPDIRTIWVNVYEDSIYGHEDRRKAVALACPGAIAVAQPVTFKVDRRWNGER